MGPLILLAMVATSQWGGSSCSPVRVAPTPVPSVAFDQPIRIVNPTPAAPRPAYGWHRIKHDGLSFPVWGFVAQNGMIEWDEDLPANVEQYRRARSAAEAARKKAEPKPAPAEKPETHPENLAARNYGIDRSKLSRGRARYTANSIEAEHFVREAQAQSEHKDRCYVTVIGDAADRKQVVSDWINNPVFDDLREKVWFQEFKRNEWQVKDELGYKADGKPTVLVQKPDGEVLLRMNSYSGPQPIANALRKADPSYRPGSDPGPDGNPADDTIGGVSRSYVAMAALFAAALILIPRRKK